MPKADMIHTLDLFEPLDDLLLDLLRSLSRDEWSRSTIAGAWTVRDVVAHLLDTPLRRLSFVRDGWPPEVVIRSDADLVALVDSMNAEGVRVYGRLSPAVLIELMTLATRQLREHLKASDPQAPAAFAVSWAGESASAHWFDVAREYTERWHHQAQIRLALQRLPPIMTPRLYAPVLATFMYGIPHALRDVDAADGTQVSIDVEGDAGGSWVVTRRSRDRSGAPGRRWELECVQRQTGAVAAAVVIPADAAWRLFTKGLSPADVERGCRWSGDATLAGAVLATRSIVG